MKGGVRAAGGPASQSNILHTATLNPNTNILHTTTLDIKYIAHSHT